MAKTVTVRSGLFDGIDAVINRALGVSNYRTRTAALELDKRVDWDVDGERLVTGVYNHLSTNWAHASASIVARPSDENFRWFKPQQKLSPSNTSREVTLERAIVAGCIKAGRTDWSNQVPLISGIAGDAGYKRWAVDLVHRNPAGFEFVELKVGRDTPLSASMQVLQYGMLWLLSRNDRNRLSYSGNPILEATTLRLSTLAPPAFYGGFQDPRLSRAIDSGLSALGRQQGVTGEKSPFGCARSAAH
jgi:hypothetical protein